MSYIFVEMPSIVQNEMNHAIKSDDAGKSLLDDQEIRGLVRTYYRVPNSKLRSELLELYQSFGRGAT